MEESPHKCPVCSRSFNQRSNLKTHLLTHTDHKPYECNSCGKVFRRNCDLRRHALTHAVGDVPADGLGEGFIQREDMETLSPRPHSPLDSQEEIRVCSPIPERTQCHEPCNSASPYTMRPHPDDRRDSLNEDENDDPEIDPGQEDQPEIVEKPDHPEVIHHPQLQIRRDLLPLNLKPSTITSSAMETSLLGPFRKRLLDADRPTTSISIAHQRRSPPLTLRIPMHHAHSSHLGLLTQVPMSRSPNILKPPDSTTSTSSGLLMTAPIVIAGTSKMDTNTNNLVSDLSMKKDTLPPPRPPQNPPKKTGFTIEDIMRR